jgi:ubiquinone/menaquinone biosynthesis C-methylase UbiE
VNLELGAHRIRDTGSVEARRKAVRNGYDAIGERYLGARTAGGDIAVLSDLTVRLGAGDTVLDAGCGAGVPVTRMLLDADFRMVGLDLAQGQLALARGLVPGAQLVQGDLSVLPFADASFDALVSYYAVIHVPRSDHAAVFNEFARVLRPDGVALLCLGANDLRDDHDPDSWLGAPMFWSHFDAETNIEMLQRQGFEILRAERVKDPMDHGQHLFVLVAHDKTAIRDAEPADW